MPLVTIWRDKSVVSDDRAVTLRDLLVEAVTATLKVKPPEVEVRVRDIGPLDINYMPIGIELDTGGGKDKWRVDARVDLAKSIAQHIADSQVLLGDWVGPDKSYVWIRICESSFVPIGHSNHAR